MSNYTVNAVREPVAAAGGGGGAPVVLSRRPSIDLAAARAADPSTNGSGASESGAPSAFDIPAFMRRPN